MSSSKNFALENKNLPTGRQGEILFDFIFFWIKMPSKIERRVL